ncbi:peptide-methionine (S)-S-oxide reductase [Zobellia barbeyronii]|uniref:peptide-methionine (S)-S-oxide reductase n=1 Tax=Zobellia barbeyronii TaxID=2748009 RepID=A0ABS5W8S0_9FLAO|nr:peptide-methionine (S)-S-oxide reductase [Zobellia barbeyronii]MBT2159825.1 peptide-methionine (S)-S-oxide reductase [Zobellia barbeyronii]
MDKIALGGGCHWCTEAVFQSLKGVTKVEQGFISSTGNYSAFSEAIIVHFNPIVIDLKDLIEIHLHTHKSTSNHSMRNKYRSAVYTYSSDQTNEAHHILNELQTSFDDTLITKVFPFKAFKPSQKEFKNYYYNNPEKPFCQKHINPKLQLLLAKYREHTKADVVVKITT